MDSSREDRAATGEPCCQGGFALESGAGRAYRGRNRFGLRNACTSKKQPKACTDRTRTRHHQASGCSSRRRYASFLLCFASPLTCSSATSGTQEWLASITSAALPQTGVVRYAAALKQVGRNKLKQRISDLPDWASPPKPALKTVIMAATGATDIEWDPMEENGSIALDFEYEQPWMSRKNVKIYIGYKQCSTLPTTTHKRSLLD